MKSIPVLGLGLSFPDKWKVADNAINPYSREYWISVMVKIADPVLRNLSLGNLKGTMPVEANPTSTRNHKNTTCLQAFGRLMAGMSPWVCACDFSLS